MIRVKTGRRYASQSRNKFQKKEEETQVHQAAAQEHLQEWLAGEEKRSPIHGGMKFNPLPAWIWS